MDISNTYLVISNIREGPVLWLSAVSTGFSLILNTYGKWGKRITVGIMRWSEKSQL
jgi:hypothetical protein